VSSRHVFPKKPTVARLRTWRVSIIRKRGQYLGTVDAPNERAAEAAAVALISATSSADGSLCRSGTSVVAGRRTIEVARVRIAEAGRQALANGGS
jgi:hypothetical protein